LHQNKEPPLSKEAGSRSSYACTKKGQFFTGFCERDELLYTFSRKSRKREREEVESFTNDDDQILLMLFLSLVQF